MKEKIIKRIICIILLTCFLIPGILLAGGQKESAKQQASVGPLTIDWLGYNTFAQPAEGNEIQKRVESKYNVKFNIWYVDKQKFDEVVGIKLASGDMPDYMIIPLTANLIRYVDQGVLAPITEDIWKRVPTYTKILKEYDVNNNILHEVTVNGKVYAFKPIWLETNYPTTVVWRTDWLKKVGIQKMPHTLGEFTEALYRFAKQDPDGNGENDTYGFSDSSMDFFFGAFGPIPLYRYSSRSGQRLHWSKQGDTYTFNAILPEMKEALGYLRKLYADGVIDPEFVTSENKGGYWAISHAFINGRIGLTGRQYYYHWAPPLSEGDKGGIVYNEFIKANPGSDFGKTFELGKPPVGPKGKSGAFSTGPANIDSYGFTTKGVKDPRKVEVICKMLEDVLNDFEYSNLVLFGINDVHYQVNPSGVYLLKKEFTGHPDQVRAGIGIFSGGMMNPEFDKKRNPPLYAFADKYATAGYVPEKVPITPAYQKYIGDLTKLTTEAYIQIITGGKPLEYFDEFVNTFKARGGDEIIREVNSTMKKMLGH
jgi:putative aldouronate transport system substrate-binding protein